MAPPTKKPAAGPRSGNLIAILGGKGGVGKSVFSVNLAMALSIDSSRTVALVDCDPHSTGDLGLISGVKQMNGSGEMVMEGKITELSKLPQIFTPLTSPKPQTPVMLLQMMQNMERFSAVDPNKLDLALKMVRRTFPITIVDCGNEPSGIISAVLDNATMILVVTNPDILVLNQTRRVLDKLQSELYPTEIVKVIVNRLQAQGPFSPQFIETTLRRQVLGVIPEDPVTASASLSRGQPFCLTQPNSPIAKAHLALSRAIIEKRLLEQYAQIAKPERNRLAPTPVDENNVLPIKKGNSKENIDPRSAFKLRVNGMLVERMDLKKEELDRSMDVQKKTELRSRAQRIVAEIVGTEDHPWKDRVESAQLTKEILDEALGLGPLEDFLADPEVTEIMVNRADLIYIERKGRPSKSKVTFSNNDQLRAIIERIVNPIGRRIDEKTPYVDARLADGSRVHAIIPPLALDGPMVTIRKFPLRRLGPEDLIKYASATPEMMSFLKAAIEAKANVLISGGTGSGKTTLLNILSGYIPDSERILTVEDSAELQLQQEHVGRLEARPPNIEGTGAVTIRDLVKQTLRMRPDRIIIGEVRAGEALDMLQAMNTGHDGSMATVHSNSPRDAIARLETLVMMAGMDLPVEAIRQQIAGAVHLIVQQSRLSDGTRKITHVTEVTGYQSGNITMQDIFVYRSVGMDKEQKVIGRHMATGFMPQMMERFISMGIHLPKEIFKAA
jgi:pilus assembly protein CpaF